MAHCLHRLRGRGITPAFEKLDELDVYENTAGFRAVRRAGRRRVRGIRHAVAQRLCGRTVYRDIGRNDVFVCREQPSPQAVRNLRASGCAKLKGLILNKKNIEAEEELAEKAAREMETEIAFILPRDPMVQRAEALRKTVVDAFPDCEMSGLYARLAERIAHA